MLEQLELRPASGFSVLLTKRISNLISGIAVRVHRHQIHGPLLLYSPLPKRLKTKQNNKYFMMLAVKHDRNKTTRFVPQFSEKRKTINLYESKITRIEVEPIKYDYNETRIS